MILFLVAVSVVRATTAVATLMSSARQLTKNYSQVGIDYQLR